MAKEWNLVVYLQRINKHEVVIKKQLKNPNKMKTKRYLSFVFLLTALSMICLLSSCIIPGCGGTLYIFNNCTEDTLFIGSAHYDNIDSVDYRLRPHTYCDVDSIDLQLWNGMAVNSKELICPDSTCLINGSYLLSEDNDTCYFFLVKWHDAKQYSWDEIRSKKLYRRWVTVKNKDGEFDRNIRYD